MIKQIQYFQAVVRCGSFTEAAEQCYISQSAVSQQIQALERRLGAKLLDRGGRRPVLTPAGEYFYQQSLALLADFERVCQQTARIANPGQPELRLGYLKSYGGQQFQLAVAEFSERRPQTPVHIVSGSHEQLYHGLRSGEIDLVLNDQRRAFSDEYVNCVLAVRDCSIEIAARNPIAALETVETERLKEIPCILAVSPDQRQIEQTYYREIMGIGGEFLFAENLEQARLMAVGGKGYLPAEGGEYEPAPASLRRVRLTRNGAPIKRTYCAFWKADNGNEQIRTFASILKALFQAEETGNH